MSKRRKEIAKVERNDKFILSETAKNIISNYEKERYPPNYVNNFVMPTKTPIITADNDRITSDSLPINNCNFNPFDKINRTLVNSYFLGYPEYSILSQNGIIQNIIQNYSEDSTREGITIFSKKTGKSTDNKNIAALEDEFALLDVQSNMRQAAEQIITYGGCKMYPKILGDDDTTGGAELETVLYPEKVARGALQYLKVIEPLYATPGAFNATRPLAKDYYEPSSWLILGTKMDSSRLCHFSYNDVPTLLKPIYWFNGMPLVQLCLDYLYGFETVRQNIVGISGRYNINIFKTNMAALLNYTDGSTFQQGQDALSRLKLAQALMNNFSIFALDNNLQAPEEWQQFNMTIAGLDSILTENAGLICAVTRMPEIKLFGRSSSKGGLGHNDETQLRLYYDIIACFQSIKLRPSYNKIFKLAQMSRLGKIDPDLDFKFKPLWKKSDTEIWQIQEIKQKINTAYFADNILEGSEIRESLSRDPDSGYNGLTKLPDEDFEDVEPDNEDNPNEKK
jgi:phage-related protein (TIGR01555 family)